MIPKTVCVVGNRGSGKTLTAIAWANHFASKGACVGIVFEAPRAALGGYIRQLVDGVKVAEMDFSLPSLIRFDVLVYDGRLVDNATQIITTARFPDNA